MGGARKLKQLATGHTTLCHKETNCAQTTENMQRRCKQARTHRSKHSSPYDGRRCAVIGRYRGPAGKVQHLLVCLSASSKSATRLGARSAGCCRASCSGLGLTEKGVAAFGPPLVKGGRAGLLHPQGAPRAVTQGGTWHYTCSETFRGRFSLRHRVLQQAPKKALKRIRPTRSLSGKAHRAQGGSEPWPELLLQP